MISQLRQKFNASFTEGNYTKFIDWVADQFQYRPPFRIAETPIFIPDKLRDQLIEACEEMVDVIAKPDFKELSERALLAGQTVPNETPHTTFLQFDFGICEDGEGGYIPQLIEAQGFPSLYFFQDFIADAYRQFFDIPDEMSHLFHGLDSANYLAKLKDIIVGDCPPEQVILLEVEPEKQTTAIDFIVAKRALGIEICCVSDIKKEGKDLFYIKEGRKIQIRRIFNRVIFDELIKRDDLKREFYLTKEANVEWVGHPNWFFRISKHTLPLLKSKYVPHSLYLNEVDQIPEDLHNYVLKPLYSFAGTGVIINLNKFDIESISDPENYILQRKVSYAPVIPTADDPAKLEVRMMLLWEKNAPRPYLVNNLVRLSKGEMVGVRYNKDKTWVGGSVGFCNPS